MGQESFERPPESERQSFRCLNEVIINSNVAKSVLREILRIYKKSMSIILCKLR